MKKREEEFINKLFNFQSQIPLFKISIPPDLRCIWFQVNFSHPLFFYVASQLEFPCTTFNEVLSSQTIFSNYPCAVRINCKWSPSSPLFHWFPLKTEPLNGCVYQLLIEMQFNKEYNSFSSSRVNLFFTNVRQSANKLLHFTPWESLLVRYHQLLLQTPFLR